jgi:ribosome-associated protein
VTATSFALRGEFITLEALIKAADLGGQRERARAAIAAGEVMVNGEIETRRGRKLRLGDRAELAGERLRVVGEDDDLQ